MQMGIIESRRISRRWQSLSMGRLELLLLQDRKRVIGVENCQQLTIDPSLIAFDDNIISTKWLDYRGQ